jgi:hypothetical protein
MITTASSSVHEITVSMLSRGRILIDGRDKKERRLSI